MSVVTMPTPVEDDLLSVDEMLSSNDFTYTTVEMPEWPKGGKPGKVRIGSLTALDMMEWQEANDSPAKKTAALRLVIRSLVDKDGNRIGKDQHIIAFQNKNTKIVEQLVKAIMELNGLGKSDQEKAKNALSEAPAGASRTS